MWGRLGSQECKGRLEEKKNSELERSLFLMNWFELALEFIGETSQHTVVEVFYVKIRGAI